ncbi:uncharacterized protein KGF55_000879 [Candida pseudojiufengensis]|uniref:uncharacterized protein n=1 Tax=Candida pseudojiufengensis TaxID=497109 RepID=UPI0022252630|nr:uncharacterized protein KGF55_000879 [Candida pseudojiufengensis]KAI5966570.1 hypothetical protein KGF55_000879 [Candida pseudojiufengensis]
MFGSGFFTSKVENYIPNKPVKFKKPNEENPNKIEEITIPELIKIEIPEFSSNYSFYINPLLSSGHVQTAYTALNNFEKYHHVHYKREILNIENKTYQVSDNIDLKYDQWKGESTIALDYAINTKDYKHDENHLNYKPNSQSKELPPRTEFKNPKEEIIKNDSEKPLLLILHGLSGGSYEAYIRAVLEKIIEPPYNFDAIVINSRGCAKHTITSPQLYNGLWTNDLRYVINEFITKKWPNKRIYLMGFSLGGAILANYLGQESNSINSQIKGAAMFGTPWDFPDGAIHLRESIIGHNVYSPTMCNNLLKLINNHNDIMIENEFIKEFKSNPTKYKIKFLKDFDEIFTSKLFGLNSANEYYRLASPNNRLLKIRIPILIISSKDDPITGYRSLPYSETELNPYITMITTTIGGHLGWFSLNGERWYVKPICEFFKKLNEFDIDETSINQNDLPLDISKSFMYDRLVNQMIVE